jgi:hypothetical protein
MSKKLGIIVPYRDRAEHLDKFKEEFKKYMESYDIDYHLIIVEQDNANIFNRGMLLNIGFVYAKKLNCDYVVFHDIDMIPVDVDYSYSDKPLQLANNFINDDSRTIFDEYFGGVTMFPIEDFEKINGYSNRYWGWGYEDNDLLFRCATKGLNLDDLVLNNFKPRGTKLKLNGINAYVKGKNFNNLLNFNNDLTLFISFYPDDLILNHKSDVDNFTIFSIFGYDTSISYNSFSRYNFLTFDSQNNPININSNIKRNYKTNICITFDSVKKRLDVYQDGKLIDTKKNYTRIHDYSLEQIFYIGCRINENKEQEDYFKGLFDSFAVYSTKLELKEIKYISRNETELLTQNTDEYNSAKKLKLYYDANFIKNYELVDLSCNENDGKIVNCEIVENIVEEVKIIKVPFRRESTFYSLQHEENGYFDNKWKNQSTRWNQLRFYNEVCLNPHLIDNDGLSDLSYTEHNKKREKNLLHIVVGI